MDNNGENLSDTLLTLQAGLNELIRYAYLIGFKDGQEFEIKICREEATIQSDEQVESIIYGMNPGKLKALMEAEQILKNYS